ncbi:MAG: peptide deformylase [Alphaproteobacteria bacterium]
MAKLEIITAPDPRLKQACRPVERVDDTVRRLMDDMLETMYLATGIGLAAPQVGVLLRVIVVDVSKEGRESSPLKMANPTIVWRSDDWVRYEEGCLSVPDNFGEVERPERVRVSYLDRDGAAREDEFDSVLATCVQHEIDHLDGVLFVDHLSALKRNIIIRRLQKARRIKAAAE